MALHYSIGCIRIEPLETPPKWNPTPAIVKATNADKGHVSQLRDRISYVKKKETHDFVHILNFSSSIMNKTLGFGLNEKTTHV